jgi:hypothetical protein
VYDNAWGKHLKPGVLDSLGVLGRKHEQAAAAAAAGRTENVRPQDGCGCLAYQ